MLGICDRHQGFGAEVLGNYKLLGACIRCEGFRGCGSGHYKMSVICNEGVGSKRVKGGGGGGGGQSSQGVRTCVRACVRACACAWDNKRGSNIDSFETEMTCSIAYPSRVARQCLVTGESLCWRVCRCVRGGGGGVGRMPHVATERPGCPHMATIQLAEPD